MHLRSSKLRWAHICAHSRIPVNWLLHQVKYFSGEDNDSPPDDESLSVFPSIFMATSTLAAALPTQTSTPPSGKDNNSSTCFCVRLTAYQLSPVTVEKPRRTP
jgi:hypothetical protein